MNYSEQYGEQTSNLPRMAISKMNMLVEACWGRKDRSAIVALAAILGVYVAVLEEGGYDAAEYIVGYGAFHTIYLLLQANDPIDPNTFSASTELLLLKACINLFPLLDESSLTELTYGQTVYSLMRDICVKAARYVDPDGY